MRSFVFIKAVHTLPAAPSATWHSTSAVPLCEAAIAGAAGPLLPPEGHTGPGKTFSALLPSASSLPWV